MKKDNKTELSKLPSVQKVLDTLTDDKFSLKHEIIVSIIRTELESIRLDINKRAVSFKSKEDALSLIQSKVVNKMQQLTSLPLKKVINATGVVLHTGLGRAPYGKEMMNYISELLTGYVNLEFDLESGERGERLNLTDVLLTTITRAESSAVVNNNAAAVLLSLNSIADGKEVIVSRGELIEIGGSFRLPDVMAKSGARMVDVGTTNRTYLKDYQEALNSETAAILIAHTSNYRIEGFTTSPEHPEIVKLAHENDLPVIMDLGSGALFLTKKAKLPYEPEVSDFIQKDFDLVTFSGDKLLGGPQCGIIVGKKKWINLLRKNPLMRAVRCDKTTFAILTWILQHYISNEQIPDIGTYSLLISSLEELRNRAKKIVSSVPQDICDFLGINIRDSKTEAGSGSMPTETIPSIAIVMSPKQISEAKLAKMFRSNNPPIVGYCKNGEFYLDLRAICKDDSNLLTKAITRVGSNTCEKS
ncbi:MAG: L-seryl-tRNA(Sec) selenium transferase [Candidatus Neomarinimicrobiota bacterium]|nr:MAG: L-seryl-tRNA(Sec) selenium transferase [Candidatus Neomarinimicrobiota bacterium]